MGAQGALQLILSDGNVMRTPNKFIPIKAVAVPAGTPVAIWTPATGNTFRLMGGMLSLSVAGSVILDDGTATTDEFIRTPLMGAAIGLALPNMENGYLSKTVNNELCIDATASGSVSGYVFGVEE